MVVVVGGGGGGVAVSGVKAANLALAFLLELAALWAVARWGWHVGRSPLARVLLAVGAATAWAAVWGLFLSPKAAVGLPGPLPEIGRWVLFGVAALALAATGRGSAALVFAAAVTVNRVLLAAWQQ